MRSGKAFQLTTRWRRGETPWDRRAGLRQARHPRRRRWRSGLQLDAL